jgi:hypothetical protein
VIETRRGHFAGRWPRLLIKKKQAFQSMPHRQGQAGVVLVALVIVLAAATALYALRPLWTYFTHGVQRARPGTGDKNRRAR